MRRRHLPVLAALLAATVGTACRTGDSPSDTDASATDGPPGPEAAPPSPDAPPSDAAIPAPDIGPTGADAAGDIGGETSALPRFSFFVTSLVAMQKLSGSQDGFGGDLRFGEAGPGAGLRGADKICAAIAETSMPGAAAKQWRAFLSVAADETGKQADARDRIGPGPWYDRIGRLVAPTLADLINMRPQNGDPAIADDLPNEEGLPNHQPDPTQPPVDNHQVLTGSDKQGRLYPGLSTCADWTTADGSYVNGRPRCGLSWPRSYYHPDRADDPIDGNHWISGYSPPGCAPGVNLVESGPAPPGSHSVGAGGGYGGIYCFALVP